MAEKIQSAWLFFFVLFVCTKKRHESVLFQLGNITMNGWTLNEAHRLECRFGLKFNPDLEWNSYVRTIDPHWVPPCFRPWKITIRNISKDAVKIIGSTQGGMYYNRIPHPQMGGQA